jgi:hypothetical protein
MEKIEAKMKPHLSSPKGREMEEIVAKMRPLLELRSFFFREPRRRGKWRRLQRRLCFINTIPPLNSIRFLLENPRRKKMEKIVVEIINTAGANLHG